jgi:uncharacterized membrane protein YbaN (DUF454 family)
MKAQVKRVLILFAGWSFVLLGILGLFLPILQGFLFLFIGLVILSSQYAWAARLLDRVRRRFPKLSHTADEASAKAAAWLQRLSGQRQAD